MTLSRAIAASALTFAASAPALAHPGHVAEQAGHSHWLAYGAAGLAVAIGLGAVAFAWRRLATRNR